jgi:hypothetical protein
MLAILNGAKMPPPSDFRNPAAPGIKGTCPWARRGILRAKSQKRLRAPFHS